MDSPPKPIPCHGEKGDNYLPSEYQYMSCCSSSGRDEVYQGLVGGFGGKYANDHTLSAECKAYTDVLKALLCDPNQGKYIGPTEGEEGYTLRVCKAACDSVYEVCGDVGVNFDVPEAKYTDGVSFCKDYWGGFGQEKGCSVAFGFACDNDLSIDVVETDCLDIIRPTNKNGIFDHYEEFGVPPRAEICNQPFIVEGSGSGWLESIRIMLGINSFTSPDTIGMMTMTVCGLVWLALIGFIYALIVKFCFDMGPEWEDNATVDMDDDSVENEGDDWPEAMVKPVVVTVIYGSPPWVHRGMMKKVSE